MQRQVRTVESTRVNYHSSQPGLQCKLSCGHSRTVTLEERHKHRLPRNLVCAVCQAEHNRRAKRHAGDS